jgi:hypothetical protein
MRKFILIFIYILISIGLIGCNNFQNEVKEPFKVSSENKTDVKKESTKVEIEGIFVGWADGHTIEIITKDGPTAFQVSDKINKKLTNIKENEKIIVFYELVNGTKMIVELK